ncbi:MAG: HD domain-containing protein [Candidatus Omnitrophota bacterium]|nr:HD domain-containing protein [Candidatus Omnitrophota bacterium]
MTNINNLKKRPFSPDEASHKLKIFIVILLFVIMLILLIFIACFPGTEIISDKSVLAVILFIVAYLWIQKVRDHHRLLALNKGLRMSHEQLKKAEIDVITALVIAEEEKDNYTCGHSERVTQIALAMAGEMGLNGDKKKLIERAGILHDIGKICISDLIICKKEKLTDEEWVIIRRHPDKAEEILKPLKFLAEEREIMLSHHERYDGRGYPRGLSGSQIREEAYILAVADAFDAMNSMRAYRKPLSREMIIAELKKSRGTQHSPEAVDALFRLLEKNPEFWQRRK